MLIKGRFERQLPARHNPSYSPALIHGARLGPGLGGREHASRQCHRTWCRTGKEQRVQNRGIPPAAYFSSSIITTHSYAGLLCSTRRSYSRRSVATPAAPWQAAPAAGATQRVLPYAIVQMAAARQSAATGLTAASAAGSGGVGTEDNTTEVVNLSGLWAKDRDRSDAKGYDAMLDVLGLSGMQKVTARLIEGLEVRQSADQFTVNFVTVVPFFKVTEVVPLNAGSTQQSRRDLRRGKQTAAAKTVNGGVLVDMSWGQPVAGSLTEVYSLLPDGSLCVHAEARVGQNQASADTIYTMSKGSRDALLSDSKRRNGSQ